MIGHLRTIKWFQPLWPLWPPCVYCIFKFYTKQSQNCKVKMCWPLSFQNSDTANLEPSVQRLTSMTPSSSLPSTSLLLTLALSMASNFTITASILDTMLPMECSILSTRLTSLRHIMVPYSAKANIIVCNHGIIHNNKRYLHLKFFIGNTAWAAATTTRAVSAVLIVVLLRVLLGPWEAPPADGSRQWVAFQLQVLLSQSSDVKKNGFLRDGAMPLTLSFSRSSLICWCSCSVSSWSPSWSYLAKMAWISASVWPFLREKQSGKADISKERCAENQNRVFFTLSDPDEVRQNSICRRLAAECRWCHLQLSSSASASSELCYIPERETAES